MILKGSVRVLKKEIAEETKENSQKLLKKSSTEFSLEKLKKRKTKNIDEEHEITDVEVKLLTAGDSFGELALLENKPRAATVICKENCHFATIEKQYFDQILS